MARPDAVRLKVLLVDDQLSHRAALSAELQAMGHDVVEAGNAEDAVALFTSLRPDAVLLDVAMPGHDGHWAAQQIRQAEPEGWTPILFLSGRVSDADLAAGIEAGGDDYLFKPVSPVVLQAKLRAMQRLWGLHHQLQTLTDQLRASNADLQAQSLHDPLTGLANRRCFIERLEESLKETAHHGERLAVLFIDLDQFKQVNDSLGHGVGDELLVSVAARLSEHVRLIDMLARLGGDEFICLMEAVRDEDEVELLAREILGAFEYPFKLGDHELYLTASVGISLCPADGHSVLDLMRNADTAMYRAKMLGRGNFHFYTAEMTREAQERIQMENLLRRALDNGELSVHLQPQVEARSARLVGAEALVRWNSPELGLVMPMRFIPLAEDSGLIVGLGNWVLRETCRQFMQWRMSGFELPQVSVNLSVKQLERPEFIDVLGEILDETGMDPSHLKLELTESVVMAVGDAFTPLERLRDLGISLALDDFGTGYSSLSYLKMLPVQQLKIDRSFVEGIGRNTGDEAIIRTIMELARSLRFEVVAEGVETVEQADFLAALGCEQLQGYLHGKAVAPAEFRARWSVRP